MSVNGREPDLSWLADAPVFMDGQQIGAFYDAVVGREFGAVHRPPEGVLLFASANHRKPGGIARETRYTSLAARQAEHMAVQIMLI